LINPATSIFNDGSASFSNGAYQIDSTGFSNFANGIFVVSPGNKASFALVPGGEPTLGRIQIASDGWINIGVFGTVSGGSVGINPNGDITFGPSETVGGRIDSSTTGDVRLIGGSNITIASPGSITSIISASAPIEYQNSSSVTGTPTNTTTIKGWIKMTLDGVQYFMPLYQ